MKLRWLSTLLILAPLASFGQAAQAYVNRSDGTPMVAYKNLRIEGSPYWQEKWEPGELKIRQTGAWKKVDEMRYNSFKNHVEVQSSKPIYYEAAQVAAFKIKAREFRNGFPPTDFFQPLDYYEVVWENPSLIFIQKHYTTRQSDAILGQSSETTGFSTQVYRYLYAQGKMVKFRTNKQFAQALQALGYANPDLKGLDTQETAQVVQFLETYFTNTPQANK